jgi:hypothetical protein
MTIMKKFYLLFSFICTAATAFAQDIPEQEGSEKKQQDIQALKVAFITKELELTSDEAEKFWPVYNQYDKEMETAAKPHPNSIEREEKILNVKKKYQGQFTKVLGSQQRMNRLFNAQDKFRKLLIRALQQRQMKRAMKRPGMRNN